MRSLRGVSATGGLNANRRTVLTALPGVIALPCLFAACSSAEPAPSAQSSAPAEGSPPAAAGTQVEQAKVPVGSAIVVPGPKPYVVAQPTQGKFVAFSASCTHRGTTVTAESGSTTLVCPAHGSEFDGATGQVLKGPAKQPLPSVPVASGDGVLTLG
jgi:cytochrome b6-f complex iron-sulfur subunit